MGRSSNYKVLKAAAGRRATTLPPLIPPPAAPAPLPRIQFVPRHDRQREVVRLWPDSTALVMVGCAGTGKTASAFAGGFTDILTGAADKVLVAKPVVGVDEDLGFFPGGLDEKLLPWMGSVEDVWGKMSGGLPLAAIGERLELRSVGLCRGRTVNRATLIVDEAQNCTLRQLVTLLTRPDDTGRIVLCGDPDQCDLPADKLVDGVCPLAHVVRRLQRRKVRRFGVVRFLPEDQQRSPFVREFLAAMGL
jgi:phosphate starvation-inducible protein PhoH and related proteins